MIVADRRSRHHVVIATQTASMLLAFTLATLTLTHRIQIWHVFTLSRYDAMSGAWQMEKAPVYHIID